MSCRASLGLVYLTSEASENIFVEVDVTGDDWPLCKYISRVHGASSKRVWSLMSLTNRLSLIKLYFDTIRTWRGQVMQAGYCRPDMPPCAWCHTNEKSLNSENYSVAISRKDCALSVCWSLINSERYWLTFYSDHMTGGKCRGMKCCLDSEHLTS